MSSQPDIRSELYKEFTGGEVQQFVGRGGQTFDFIQDETVMDRLDDVFGIGMWSITVEPISLADGVVKVRLAVGDAVYEDFGYATRTDGEALKEAVSDGIRRCGRFLGIGRYLYKKHVTVARLQPAQQRPPLRAVTAPQSIPDDPYGDDFAVVPAAPSGPNCAIHGVAWKGEPGDLYHKKDEGGYCRHPENVQKPARAR